MDSYASKLLEELDQIYSEEILAHSKAEDMLKSFICRKGLGIRSKKDLEARASHHGLSMNHHSYREDQLWVLVAWLVNVNSRFWR